MRYSYAQKSAILQKILSKIQKEFRFCNTDEEIDCLMKKYDVSMDEPCVMPVSKTRSVVLVIGALAGKKSDYQRIAKKLGISDKNIEFVDDYSKMHGFSTAKLRYSEKYSDMILGPVPHRMELLEGESSLFAAVNSNPEIYPKLGLATANSALKITLNNFRDLLMKTRYFQDAI